MKEGNTGFSVGLWDILILPQLAGDNVRIGTEMLDPGSFQQLRLPPPSLPKVRTSWTAACNRHWPSRHLLLGVSALAPVENRTPPPKWASEKSPSFMS